MNDSHDWLEEPNHDSLQNDPLLDEMFSHLRRLEPSLDARLRYRLVVVEELERLQAMRRKQALPWWGRTIALPVPLAASLVVVAGLMLFSFCHDGRARSGVQIAAPIQPVERSAHIPSTGAVAATHAVDAHPVVEYYETETYLCGIGRLKSESGYLIREENQ